MLFCCSSALSSFTLRKSSFLSDDRLNSRMYSVRWFLFFHSDCFFNFYCPFRQRFSSAYLLKLFLPPQCVHTTLFIRCDKPELTRWCLCSLHAVRRRNVVYLDPNGRSSMISSLHAVIQMSPDEVVGSRDGCRHSIVEGTVNLPVRLFRQIFIVRTALFSCPFA